MNKSGLFKNFYHSKEKGVSWWLYSGTSIANPNVAMDATHFYLLPTITFEHWDVGYEVDQSFDISFKWLFWYFTITKYWGEAYKKH